jgi:hypothetical protein
LEALFAKTAHTNHPSKEPNEDSFYNALAATIDDQITPLPPLPLAQKWIAENDPNVIFTAAFTETDTPAVDAAYEYVFTNIAMMADPPLLEDGTQPQEPQQQQYLVMPHFLSTAATSFEKFTGQVENIIACLPDVRNKVTITTFHPEHIDSKKRSPYPILALQWNNNNTDA